MHTWSRTILAAATVAAVLVTAGCGGGPTPPTAPSPGSFDVRVSAGSPVAGAIVTVYAISDSTGAIDGTAGAGGVLGSAGPTDSSGRVSVPTRPYAGPVQVVASGLALYYADPASPPDSSGAPVYVQMPASFTMSSYVTRFTAGEAMVVPVTLYTTLADHAALAYARGLSPTHPAKANLTDAIRARDPLFVQHITTLAAGWDPAALRTTVPADLARAPHSLVNSAFAAIFDVALNGLARDRAVLATYGSSGLGITAPVLLQILEADLDADGVLDGKGEGGKPLALPGATGRPLDGQFLRMPMAMALDGWARRADLNKSGIGPGDLLAGNVYEAIVRDSSALFADPPAGSVDALIDRAPPIVTWEVEPAVAVTTPEVTLTVRATDDRSGVSRVLGQAGTNSPVEGTPQGADTWTLTLGLLPGPNRISVWAEDAAALPNSGRFMSGPHELATTVFWDFSDPSIAYNTAFASYRDERGMTVGKDTAGLALVPAVHEYADPTPLTIPSAGGHVYKAATRLGWVAPPTAAVLEDPVSGNPDNIPVLQFWVPYVEGVDAPIVSATYAVSIACAGCSYADATGPLWPSPSQAPGVLLFDLPLSSNLVPALPYLPAAATLAVTVRVSDAAGNQSSVTPVSLTFHTIGGPLAISEDLSYPGQREPRSTYPYTIATGLYSDLFALSPAAFLPEQQVRLIRYLVSNPAPSSVALALPRIAGGWRMVETWPGSAGTPLGTVTYPVANIVCSRAPTCGGTTPIAYGGGSAGGGCGTSPPHNMTPATDNPVVVSGDLATFAYAQNQGVDLAPAVRTPAGQVVVPPAEGGAPGVVALYVGRPAGAPARSYVLPWTGSGYQYVVEDAWTKIWQGTTVCCDYDAESRRCFQFAAPTTWAGTRFIRTLAAGVDSLEGSFEIVTNGMSGAVVVGEANTVGGVVSVTRAIPH